MDWKSLNRRSRQSFIRQVYFGDKKPEMPPLKWVFFGLVLYKSVEWSILFCSILKTMTYICVVRIITFYIDDKRRFISLFSISYGKCDSCLFSPLKKQFMNIFQFEINHKESGEKYLLCWYVLLVISPNNNIWFGQNSWWNA